MAEPGATVEPKTESDTPRHVVVVGGMGAVGHMFTDLFARLEAQVCVVDTAPAPAESPGVRVVRGDVTALDPMLESELADADVVVLAVAEPVALAALGPVAARMRPDALLVDTLSVKGNIVRQMCEDGRGLQMVSLNPMFAPSLGMAGRPVAVVTVRDGPRARGLKRLIDRWGGRVVAVTAEEHDHLVSATQALTHAAVLAFGLALSELGADIADLARLAPPPHAAMLALLARIASGSPEVYWDVQFANSQASAARAALADGVRRLAAIIDGADEAQFTAAMDRLRGLFGSDLGHHRRACERLFSGMVDP